MIVAHLLVECDACGVRVRQKNLFLHHLRQHCSVAVNNTARHTYVCDRCAFATTTTHKQHFWAHHLQCHTSCAVTGAAARPLWCCDACDDDSPFADMPRLQRHIRIVHLRPDAVAQSVVCDGCERTFVDRWKLLGHVQSRRCAPDDSSLDDTKSQLLFHHCLLVQPTAKMHQTLECDICRRKIKRKHLFRHFTRRH